MEFRKVFDTIPEQFDRYRPRYSAELFADLIAYENRIRAEKKCGRLPDADRDRRADRKCQRLS